MYAYGVSNWLSVVNVSVLGAGAVALEETAR